MEKDKREQEKLRPKARSANGRRLPPVFMRSPVHQKALLLAALSLLISLLLTPSFTFTSPHYRLGDIADRNIKAKRDFLIEDEEATRKKREEAAQQAPIVCDLYERALYDVDQRLEKAFGTMRKIIADGLPPDGADAAMALAREPSGNSRPAGQSAAPPAPPRLEDVLASHKKDFESFLGIDVSDDVYQHLCERRFDASTQHKVSQLLEPVFQQGLVADKGLLYHAAGRDLVIRRIQSQDEKVAPSPYFFLDMEEAKKLLRVQALELGKDMEYITTISSLAIELLQPNITFNLSETELRKEAVAAFVKPVYIQIKKNEMLVREGQRIGLEELLKLQAHKQKKSRWYRFMVFMTIFVFSALCMWFPLRFSGQYVHPFPQEVRDFIFLASVIALLLMIGRFTVWIGDSMGEGPQYLSSKTLIYALPLTAGAMLSSIFYGATFSLIFSLVLTIFSTILFGRDFGCFIYFLVGCFVAAHTVIPCRNRMTPIRSGLLVGGANIVLVLIAAAFENQLFDVKTLINALAGFCGGASSGILVTGLTPLAEITFGYTTDIKLMELATMEQPLLQELMVQAPGTYHHSIIVGNMVESAGKSIGANSQLAKVAAYYHDIGKIKKPLYFIENQFECDNRHEKLAPSMSSLILISHVKEGAELAKQHHLGKPIMDIIQQHHGTSLISFFYKKALDAREKTQSAKGAELPPINIDDYRYPGPKPQTKEAGLVMLADVVEAACRSLTEPTPARIKGLVNKLINNIFIDGQLDECELTLKDLHYIARHFNQILATVHHKRVEYPTLPAGDGRGKTDAGNSTHREPKPDRDRPSANQEDSKKDLKRLGLQ